MPDVVVTRNDDYETFNTFKKNITKNYCMIFELHGEVTSKGSFRHIFMHSDTGRLEEKLTFVIVDSDDNGASLFPDGSNVAITGVIWNDRKIYTDSAHIKAEQI